MPNDKKGFKLDTRLFAVIGVIIFLYIISKSDFAYLKSLILNINPYYLSISLLLVFFTAFLKSYKWKVLLKSAGHDYSMKRSIIVWLISFGYGFITPGRLGDFIRIFYLNSDLNLSKTKGFIICLVDRLIDLFSLIIGTIIVYTLSINFPTIIFLTALLVLIIGVIILLLIDKYSNLLPKAVKTLYLKAKGFAVDALRMYKYNQLIIPLIIGLISWFFTYLQAYLALLAVGKSVNFILLSAAYSTSILVSLLPVSIGGLGTTEATMFFFLSNYVTLEEVIALSFILNVIGLWIPALTGFVLNALYKSEVK